jgi:HK97 gp10 family phage protein
MSVRMTVSTRNLRALAANFQAADARIQKRARRTVKKFGKKQLERTEQLAPYDASHPEEDFHLRDNIRLRFSDDGLVYEVGFLEEDFRAEGLPFYALYTEFGTRFMAPRPCVFPARDESYPQFKAALGADLRGEARRGRK